MWRSSHFNRWRSVCFGILYSYFNVAWFKCNNIRKMLNGTERSIIKGLPTGLVFVWPFTELRLNPKERSQRSILKMFNEAQEAVSLRDFSRADLMLHRLLERLHADHEQGLLNDREYIERRVRVYSDLANISLIGHRLDEAEKLLKQIIRDCHSLAVPLADPMIVELSLKLALIYQQMGRKDEADLGFSYCVNALDRTSAESVSMDANQLKEVKALLGMCHNHYSKFLYEVGSLESSLRHAQSAYHLASEIYEVTHPNCLHIAADIAAILIDLMRYSEAQELIDHTRGLIQSELSSSASAKESELFTCLAPLLLHQIVLNARRGELDAANETTGQLEVVLTKCTTQDEIRQQLLLIRKQYNLAS